MRPELVTARPTIEILESSRRISDAVDAWVAATPDGMTADEIRHAARRFVAIAEDIGPRRGLMRFRR